MSNTNSLLAQLRVMPNESPQKMLLFTVSLCFICSLLVSGSHVLLRPYQKYNKELERSRNILHAAGLLESDSNVLEIFKKRITTKLVDLPSGKLAPVYLVKNGAQIETIVLPVSGYGLWSTMYGFLALKSDARTVLNLIFYEHGETPGLGAEITNPNWLMKWKNKVMYNENGAVVVRVIKGKNSLNKTSAQYEIDAIAGATLTSRGVENLMRYWLGEQGFGPFLASLQIR